MSASNFKTENNTYRKLIGNGLTYQIPPFQRDYSWSDEEWEDLWVDILGVTETDAEPAHYMGYLVLQSQDDKTFYVIDGQQRLTTLTILVLAVLKNLQRLIEGQILPEQNQRRLDQIRQTYIGYLDPVTLVSRSKLTLNHSNDHYFQTHMVPLGHLPQRGLRASEHSLRKAFEWFDKRVTDHIKSKEGDRGVCLATLIENLSDKLFFTVINVTDELNAFKVFETLNARGVRLSSTDLLKNHLFSIVHRAPEHANESQTLEDRWERMVTLLGSESFPDFLRVHWNSRKSFVRQAELFKTIRGKVTTRAEVFELLRDMEEDMDTYLSLTNPETSHWEPKLRSYAQTLRMFSVRQPFSLIVAGHRRLDKENFASLLKACVTIAFRYNVIGSLPTYEQERVYYAAAQKICNAEINTAGQVLKALADVYPTDAAFISSFTEKTVRTTNSRNLRLVRYMLCALERQISQIDHDFDSDTFNVEHILPQNPAADRPAFSDEEARTMAYRIGNMALMSKSDNKSIGSASFALKKPVLAASQFEWTRKVAQDNADWNPECIAARQNALARMAAAVWRVDQLSN